MCLDKRTINVSIVIICLNAERTLEACILSCKNISEDIIVADTGSEDRSKQIALQTNAELIEIPWMGYGATKNTAAKFAKNDWILSIDSDEVLSNDLIESLREILLDNQSDIYGFKRISYLGEKPLKYGDWGNDVVNRLYNKKNVMWNNSEAHEKLIFIDSQLQTKPKKISGTLLHYTAENIDIFNKKQHIYARLMAEKLGKKGKKVSFAKPYFSAFFTFIQNYIFKRGFLDGKEGLALAICNSRYTYNKYKFLYKLTQTNKAL